MDDELPSLRQCLILIAVFTLGAMALIAATGWYYLRQRAAREATVNQGLTAIAAIKAEQVANWRRERLGDGRVFASSAILRIARRVLSSPVIQPADRADLLDAMKRLEGEFLYTGAALVDHKGTIRLESNVTPSDPPRVAELGRAATQRTDVSLHDLYWDAKLGRPLMALSVPVHGLGAFLFTIDPSRFLYPFLKQWPVPSATAETILVRREGNKTVYLSNLRHKPGSAFHFWRPNQVPGRPEAQTKSGWVFKRSDYRGVTVLGTEVPVPNSPWYLIAKIDISEVDAPVSRLGWEMALIIALIALANATGAGFIWRSQQMRFYRERERWFQQIANDTPAYLWMTSAEEENVFVNRPFAEFLGTDRQMLGKEWTTYLDPETAQQVFERFSRSMATRTEYVEEQRVRRFDGEYRWFISTGRPRFSKAGKYLGHSGSMLDITERKEAEDRARETAEIIKGQNRVLELIAQNAPLQKSLDALVRIIEARSPDMLGSILLLDADGVHLRHGAAPSLPQTYTRAVDGEPIGPAAGSCGTAAFRREPVIVEDIATDPLWDNYRELALSHGLRACWSTPIFKENRPGERNLLGTFALYFRSPRRPDPRHRELIEMATQTAAIAIVKAREAEALQTSEERLRLAATYGELGVWDWQIDTGRLIWSKELWAMFGWAKQDGDLTLKKFLEAIIPEDRDRTEEALNAAAKKGEDYDVQFRICLPDGSVRWIAAHGRTQYGPAREPVRMLGVAQDVTGRKQAEHQLERAYAVLAQELEERARKEKEIQGLSARLMSAQEEERSRLARELHDDLSQQIAAVSVAASNLKTEIPAEFADARSQSERIRERLADLGQGVRRMSHELHPAILQYSGLDTALRAYCSEFAALAKIQVNFRSDGSFRDMPSEVALCAYRITQEALQNVAKHARTDKAEVTVTHSGSMLKLIISDNGIGMDPNTAGGDGGLGLTSIRERARLVNGRVDIQSRPGAGTTVTLTVPVQTEEITLGQ